MFLLCAAGAGFAAGRLVRTGAVSQSASGNGDGDGQRSQFGAYAPPMVGEPSMSAPLPVGAAPIQGVAP
jgi:hypothetical protein